MNWLRKLFGKKPQEKVSAEIKPSQPWPRPAPPAGNVRRESSVRIDRSTVPVYQQTDDSVVAHALLNPLSPVSVFNTEPETRVEEPVRCEAVSTGHYDRTESYSHSCLSDSGSYSSDSYSSDSSSSDSSSSFD